MRSSRRYCLISPCRDEASFLARTVESVARQSVPPSLWVVVDDGSTDATRTILESYRKRLPFLRIVTRKNRGKRSVGPGVIQAFYHGYKTIDPDQFEYICKLDLDLELPSHYFETLIERMEKNPRIGTCSGKPYFRAKSGSRLIAEFCGDEMSVGMTKFYRTICFQQIGGFVQEVMWDGIDCHRCRMLGWIACSWDEPSLRFIHLRPMGASQSGIWSGRRRHGFGQYFMGTTPIYLLLSAGYRISQRPFVIGALGVLWGYLISALRREDRYEDLEFRRFLRKYQWSCLWLGKKGATRRLDERQRAAWQTSWNGNQRTQEQPDT